MRILNFFHYWWFVIHNFFFFFIFLYGDKILIWVFFFAIIIYANITQLVLARALNHPHFCHCTMCLTNTFSKKKCFLRAPKTGQFSAVTKELKSTLVSALLHDSEFVQRSPSSAWEVREQKVGHPKSINWDRETNYCGMSHQGCSVSFTASLTTRAEKPIQGIRNFGTSFVPNLIIWEVKKSGYGN